MKSKHVGCLAVAVLLTGMILAGCIGSEAGGQADDAEPTGEADDIQPDQNTNDTDVDDNATDVQDDEPVSYRTPTDAMSVEPSETGDGMARFTLEDSMATSAVFSVDAEAKTYQVHDPGDLVFFDVWLTTSANDGAPAAHDLDLHMYNESGDEVASSASAQTNEYLYHFPAEETGQNFTLEVVPFITQDTPYTLQVTAWTHPEWNITRNRFADVWEMTYEWGQTEVCPPAPDPPVDVPTCVSVVAFPGDSAGVTDDGIINTGGVSWDGCAVMGGGANQLPCPRDPYKSMSIIIDDDVAGQQVAAIWTTCSDDDDTWCGETDNVNDTKADGNPGPNELTATFCGVVNGLTRDGTTDKDGTGPGIWNQRGEMYETTNGTMAEHPGVDGISVFLVGPQRGGGGICSDANPYTGPTQGTITIIAQK